MAHSVPAVRRKYAIKFKYQQPTFFLQFYEFEGFLITNCDKFPALLLTYAV